MLLHFEIVAIIAEIAILRFKLSIHEPGALDPPWHGNVSEASAEAETLHVRTHEG